MSKYEKAFTGWELENGELTGKKIKFIQVATSANGKHLFVEHSKLDHFSRYSGIKLKAKRYFKALLKGKIEARSISTSLRKFDNYGFVSREVKLADGVNLFVFSNESKKGLAIQGPNSLYFDFFPANNSELINKITDMLIESNLTVAKEPQNNYISLRDIGISKKFKENLQ